MKTPRIELICVGSELLNGKVNTHAAYLGRQLQDMGFHLTQEHTVGDSPQEMFPLFKDVWTRSTVAFCAGGLGPTFDDITRDIWSKVLNQPLTFNSSLLTEIKIKFKNRNLNMPPKNKRQAFLLKGAMAINNQFGTAPGQFYSTRNKHLILLPGPARELKPMVENVVLPQLRMIFGKPPLIAKCFHLIGIPESKVDQMIRPLIRKYEALKKIHVQFGILASNSIITVKYQLQGSQMDLLNITHQKLTKEFRRLLSVHLFGEDDDTLSSVVSNLLRNTNKTLSIAESCTGGLIAKTVTDLPGSSEIFTHGVITYSNQSKTDLCGVPKSILYKFGAVSAQTAKTMAQGLRKKAKTDYSLAVTGIAGPTGGSQSKPIGLVFIAVASPKRSRIKKFLFNGSREWIRHRSSLVGLDFLRKEILMGNK